MKKHISTLLFICLLATHLSAQNTFQRAITGKTGIINGTISKADKGRFLFTGIVSKQSGDNIFVSLLDKNGKTVWAKYFTDNINNPGIVKSIQTADGGFIIAASEYYKGQFSLLKLDTNGNILYSKIYSGFQYFTANSVVNAYNGNVTIAGNTYDKGFILNINQTSGAVVWMKTLGTYQHVPNDGAEIFSSIAKTKDSGYVIGGYAKNLFGNSSTEYDMLMTKYNKDGIIVWTKIINPSTTDHITSVVEALDGGYVFAGNTRSIVSTGVEDISVLKTDVNGNTIWAKQFDNGQIESAWDMIKTDDSSYILISSSSAVKVNNNGSVQWLKNFVFGNGIGSYYLNSILKTNDNGFILSAPYYKSPNFDSALLIKYYINGNTCNGTTTLNPTTINLPIATYAYTVVPADATALVQIVNGLYSKVNGKAVNTNICNSAVTGINTEVNINAINSNKEFQVILSPNPVVNNVLNVAISYSKTSNVQLAIMNMEGKIVLSQKVTLASDRINKQLNISNLPAGIYILKINDGMQQQTVKFVKQ